jgi:hypothetical protein
MNEEMPLQLTIAEKIIGLVLIIFGIIITYFSLNPPQGDISLLSGLFVVIGLIIAVTGVFLIIVKGE